MSVLNYKHLFQVHDLYYIDVIRDDDDGDDDSDDDGDEEEEEDNNDGHSGVTESSSKSWGMHFYSNHLNQLTSFPKFV